MPTANGVGEPCARERHARFEVAGAGNGVARSAICGLWVGVLRYATTMTWSEPSRSISYYRASARPYTSSRESLTLIRENALRVRETGVA